jgi:hypothetical protein
MGIGGSFPGSKSGRDVKLITHLHPVARSRKLELWLHSPIYLHGIVLNQLKTAIALIFMCLYKNEMMSKNNA